MKVSYIVITRTGKMKYKDIKPYNDGVVVHKDKHQQIYISKRYGTKAFDQVQKMCREFIESYAPNTPKPYESRNAGKFVEESSSEEYDHRTDKFLRAQARKYQDPKFYSPNEQGPEIEVLD